MKRRNRVLDAIVIRTFSTVFLLLTAVCSSACSCIDRTVSENFDDSRIVFVGVVTSAEVIRDKIEIEARVVESFKGVPAKEVSLSTGIDTARCGWGSIEVNTKYLFYAGANGSFDICSGTKKIMGVRHNEELELLRSMPGT